MTRWRSRRGTTAVEFAVVSTVVLMLIFTAMDLGLLYLAQQALNNGVARAVRYAAVSSTSSSSSSIANRFVATVTPVLGAVRAAACHVSVSFAPSNTPGGSVTVQATLVWYPFTSFDYMPSVTLSDTQSLVIQH